MTRKSFMITKIPSFVSRNISNTRDSVSSGYRNTEKRVDTQRSFFDGIRGVWIALLKLINYSCSSYPTRSSYSGQVDGFRNPTKNELNTTACLELISNTDENFLNLHIDKARKTHDEKQLYSITRFTKQTLNLNYLLLTLNTTERLLNSLNQKMATSSFGSLSTLLYTSNLKWHWR